MKSYKRKKSTAWMLVLVMVLSLMTGVGVLPKEVAKADVSNPGFCFRFPYYDTEQGKPITMGLEGYKEDSELKATVGDSSPTKTVYLLEDGSHAGCFVYEVDPVSDPENWRLKWDVDQWTSNNNKVALTMNNLTLSLSSDQLIRRDYDSSRENACDQWSSLCDSWDGAPIEISLIGDNVISAGGSHILNTGSDLSVKKGSESNASLTVNAVNSQTIECYEWDKDAQSFKTNESWWWCQYAVSVYGDSKTSNSKFSIDSGVTLTATTTHPEAKVGKGDISLDGVKTANVTVNGKIVGKVTPSDRYREKDALCVAGSDVQTLLNGDVGKVLYTQPKDGNTYLGKVYYYSSQMMYPNVSYQQVLDQNAGSWESTDEDDIDWTYRGIYDENGTPRGSHIFVQYYHLNRFGGVLTEDGDHPVSYLIYDEYPENKSSGSSPADAFSSKCSGFVNSCKWTDIKGDGSEILSPGEYHAKVTRTFTGDFYGVWGLYGNVTINGNVVGDCVLDRGYRSEEKDDTRVYVGDDRDENGRPIPLEDIYNSTEALSHKLFQDEDFSRDTENSAPLVEGSYKQASLTVNGNCGFLSLTDTYEGSFSIASGKTIDGMGLYYYSDEPYRPDEARMDFYGTYVGTGSSSIVTGGHFIDSIRPLGEDEVLSHYVFGAHEDATVEDIKDFVGYSVINGRERDGEQVAGTSTAVDTVGEGGDSVGAVDIDVSSSVGRDVYPMVRRKTANGDSWKAMGAWWTAIKDALPTLSKATIMDIALVQDNAQLVEPTETVNLYVNGLAGWGSGCALYHVTPEGKIEKLSSGGASGSIVAPTNGFSTYFVADDVDVPQEVNQDLAALASAQHREDNPQPVNNGGGYVGPGGGGSGGSGGSGDKTPASPTPVKEVTDNEKDADGHDVTTTTKTYEDGSKQITETVKDPNTGEVLKTTETSVKTDETTGDKTTESKTVTKDGTETESKLVEKKDGSTSETVKVTQPSGATSERKETKETDGSSEVIVTDTKANGDYTSDTITTKVVPSADGSGTQIKTVIEREEKKEKTETTAKYTVSDPEKKTLVLTSFTTNAKETTISIGSGIEADGVSYKITAIAPKAFKGNKKVKKFNSGNSVTKLGDQMLMKAKNLKKVVLGKNVKELGAKLFNKASSLKNILINSGKITKVGARAFDGISKDAVIKIDASVKAFRKIKKLIVGSGGVPKGVKFKRI